MQTKTLLAVLAATLGAAGLAHAQSCPDVAQSGAQITGTAVSLSGGGMTADVIAGGNIDLGTCGTVEGHGYIIEAPDFELQASGITGATLTLSVLGGCDTVLLVNDSSGQWYFDDDSAGNLNPQVTVSGAGDGTYDIWVGTYGQEICEAMLLLAIAD